MKSLSELPRLTRREVADRMGVRPESVDRWCRAGIRGYRLPRYRFGGRSYVLQRDLDWWIRATSDLPEDAPDPTAEEQHDLAMRECRSLGL